MLNGGVHSSTELRRILALPTRDPAAFDFVEELSDIFRRPGSTAAFRRVQALALYEIAQCRGGLCAVEVGGGKTLISLLAAMAAGARKPILLTRGGLVQKTNRDRALAEKDWLVPSSLRVLSYEMLGQRQWAAELEAYAPDLIIADEVQRLKNPGAAVTRRVTRYMEAHPETMFVALSGTVMSKSLLDFGHLIGWALKEGSPLPRNENDLLEWSSALDDNVEELSRYDPGALLNLADAMGVPPSEGDLIGRAREGFRRRLVQTPGVVTSDGESAEHVGASIYVRAIEYDVPPSTIEHLHTLRSAMVMPDGRELLEGSEVWRHARELAIGLVYVWNPWPPDEWLLPRRKWHSFVRSAILASDTLDSEAQVVEACERGLLHRTALDAWRAVERSFTPNVEPRWHDDAALKTCLAWMRRPGLVWTEHSFFGRRLAQLAGVKYYGQKGLNEDGGFIDDAPNDRAIVVSADANREGRNLQEKWSRNLIVSPTESAEWWQQLIGRTHRSGQTADEVEVDVLLGCLEHVKAWRGARAQARAVQQTTGAVQKLLIADIDDAWPSDEALEARTDARWRVPPKQAFRIPAP